MLAWRKSSRARCDAQKEVTSRPIRIRVSTRERLPQATEAVAACLGARNVPGRYRTAGSANPEMVRAEAERWKKVLAERRG